MCGIAGCISSDITKISPATLSRMKSAIVYRGKDDKGEWSDARHARLYHSRLTVIDIATGHQPMVDAGDRYVIVYNGEIYNYLELKEEYKKSGAVFKTHSDTEVILEGFKQKGPGICNDLNGMYAFAIWDRTRRVLFMARDRLGKKPLFWTVVRGMFYFASTLDAFHDIEGWDRQLSRSNLILYQTMGAFWESATVYKHAYSVPAASYAFVSLENLRPEISKYWHLDFSGKSRLTLGRLMEEYDDILTDAVKIRLRSDVPIALSFSGGVDSGTIAAMCTKKLNTPVKAFTIDYHVEKESSADVINAQHVARHLGIELKFINYDYKKRLMNDLDGAYRFYDQPCQHLPLVYSYKLYESIKPYATVALSGNGADELFTGYIGDHKVRQKDIVLNAVKWLRPLLGRSRFRNYFRYPFPRVFAELLLTQARAVDNDRGALDEAGAAIASFTDHAIACSVDSVLDMKMFYNICCSTVGANFTLGDISGLAAQVEVRSPFLDYRMVEFASKLPHRYKVGSLFTSRLNKYLPKLVYQEYVPRNFAWSRKKGLSYNIQFAKYIEENRGAGALFTDSYDAIDSAGLNSGIARAALGRYMGSLSNAKKPDPSDSRAMMNSFLLGRWLLLHKGLSASSNE